MSGEKQPLMASGLASHGSIKEATGTNSTPLTATIIISDVIGAGILSIAVAIAKFGWLLGSIMTVVLLAMNIHISIIMWRVRMKCPMARTYAELAKEAFAGAPATIQQGAFFLTQNLQLLLIGCCLGVFTLSLGKGMGMLFYDMYISLPFWTFLGCVLVFPFLASARKLGSWQSLLWLNCAAILASVTIPICLMANEGTDKSRIPGSQVHAIAEPHLDSILSGLNIMIYAFTSQFMLVEIMAEMDNVAEFPQAYILISAPFQFVAFLLCGLGGYYFRGDLINGMLPDAIPFGFWFRVTAGCIIISMLITWLVKGMVFCRALQSAYHPTALDDVSATGWMDWFVIVVVALISSWIMAQIVPFFVDLINIIGAMLMPTVCFLIPIVLYARCLWDFGTEEDRVSYAERAVIGLEVGLSLVMLVVGTYLGIEKIITSWDTYGYPFAVHCENMWNTCECSASHPGMEHCIAFASLLERAA